MLPKLAVKYPQKESGKIIQMYPEELVARQERLLIENLPSVVHKIECQLEELDNDCKQTIELDLFGLNIYVDVATRGWDYRSIELLAVDIMNDENDALNKAAKALYNTLWEVINRLNIETDKQHYDY